MTESFSKLVNDMVLQDQEAPQIPSGISPDL